MFGIISALIIVALAASSVNAHGYVQEVVIDDTDYTGYLPYTDPYMNPVPERIIRRITGNGMWYCPPICITTTDQIYPRSSH